MRKVKFEATSVFPVLMITEDDPASGELTFKPLPLEWALLWRWLLWYWLPGAIGNLLREVVDVPAARLRPVKDWGRAAAARLELEYTMSLILLKAGWEVCRV